MVPPTRSPAKPSSPSSKPSRSSAKPSGSSSKPSDSPSKAPTSSSKPSDSSSKPSGSSPKTSGSSPKTSGASSKISGSSSKTSGSSPKPSASSSKPSSTSSKLPASVSKPTVSSAKPSAASIKPSASSTKPAVSSSKASGASIKPSASPVKPKGSSGKASGPPAAETSTTADPRPDAKMKPQQKDDEPLPETSLDVVCIPMNVDAFVLNQPVCDTGLARIAPITQPDYLGLRTNNQMIQHDILPHVDVHRTQPSTINSRVSAVETPSTAQVDPNNPGPDMPSVAPTRDNRIGVYLHWSLPRAYRSAISAAEGTDPLPTGDNTSSSPTFRLIPNRWAVLRNLTASYPVTVESFPSRQAWIIESDRLWNVDELDATVDLETDVSPFVAYTAGDETTPDVLNKQAGVYIGAKSLATTWSDLGSTVPRVPLTIMNSSNFCFADNTIHNSNVLSMVDDFEYTDAQGNIDHYLNATCDYVVIGWHSSADDDPLGPNGLQGSLTDRLAALFCTLGSSRFDHDVSGIEDPTRIVCYGVITNVQYDRFTKPTTPAETFGSLFTSDVQMEPVSIGTTALDSVLTFLQAHKSDEDSIFGTGTDAVAQDILNLSELLYATDDSYDTRVKAADLIDAQNFASSSGGNAWHYSGKASPGGAPAEPPTVSEDGSGFSPLDYLNQVNDLQLQLDAANRKLQLTRWSLFAVWWDYLSDPNNSDPTRMTQYQTQVTNLRNVANGLITLISNDTNGTAGNPTPLGLTWQINEIVRNIHFNHGPIFLPKVFATSIALPPFYQRRDPTICVAGVDAGWPSEYTGILTVNVDEDFDIPTAERLEDVEVPSIVPVSAARFVADPPILATLSLLVQYIFNTTIDHTSEIGFKTWSGQPWCPLFIEWEATYYHIPFDKWSVQILNSPVGNNHDQVRYGLNSPLYDDPQSTADQRTVAGRIILTPQPTVNLQALVKQVLSVAGTAQPTDMSADALVAQIGQLKLISSELSGITNNLLTLADGTHVQPNLSIPGETELTPLTAAVTAGAGIGLTEADLALIADQSGLTPYGTLVDFTQAPNQPFKPVTHGQFRFTKLNIVDKFGQVISGITPTADLRVPDGLPESLHPCLGDQVCPGLVPGTSLLNTVTALTAADPQLPGGYPLCPYVQLTPAINQNARLNAAFVEAAVDTTGAFTGWKATNDWEQPVWAWVVINYADYGMQFFTSDGTFYVEMSLGGPTGTIESTKWLPFEPPTSNSIPVSPQLVQLIAQMNGTNGTVYLRSFWDMIIQAVENMPYAPADYAAYASSIIGKPLALVNAGLSLELDTAPLQSQTTLPPTGATTNGSDPADLLSYSFPIKIGDADRPYDGVLGYFDSDNTTTGATDWTKLYTYFPAIASAGTQPGDPRLLIQPSSFPTLNPYYIEPDGPLTNGSFTQSHAAEFLVKTMLIDPYTPLHIYSPILPITALQLPAWTVQGALQKMSAFFKLGPCLVTKDVPAYDNTAPLEADSWVAAQQALASGPATAPIRLPLLTGKKGLWNWLQPYNVPGDTEPQYNGFEVGEDDGRIRLDPGPYTQVEGFLQLVQPLQNTNLPV